MYEIGDYVIKPSDGVCRIENILHLDMSGVDKNKLYYLLIPVGEKNRKIYIPVDTADKGTRKTMSEEEAWKLIDKIPDIEEIWVDNEKLREQRYKEAIKSGKPGEWIRIIKTSYLRSRKREAEGKRATTVDDRYFHTAEDHLYAELAVVLGMDRDAVKKYIGQSIEQLEV